MDIRFTQLGKRSGSNCFTTGGVPSLGFYLYMLALSTPTPTVGFQRGASPIGRRSAHSLDLYPGEMWYYNKGFNPMDRPGFEALVRP